MASVNKVIIVGNLGKDPEMRTFPSGDQIASVSIATTDKWKDKQTGEAKEATEWHRVTFNGRLAEIAGQYLRKGSQAYVEGSLRTRKWTDQAGVEKYSTEIRADVLQLLDRRTDGEPQADRQQGAQQAQQPQRQAPQSPSRNGYADAKGGAQRPAQAAAKTASGFDDFDDDIPF